MQREPLRFGTGIMARLDELARISQDPPALSRHYLTAEHKAAGNLIKRWMEDAGMSARFDAIGNVVGRYEGDRPGLPALLTGSHFDTVRNAGRYDGMLGVVTPIACIAALHDEGVRLPFAIEVIAFADEEGVRFNATLLGSRAVAGTFDPALLAKKDADGVTMAEALTRFGLDPARVGDAAHRRDEVLGYVEIHIEQGPVLLEEGRPVGVVTSIAGASRFAVRIDGLAGHAGTVPMSHRRDAAAAAAEMVLAIERRCSAGETLVGTVGVLGVPNGATNVIPGSATFTIDIRAGDDAVRKAAVDDVLNEIAAIASRRRVDATVTPQHDARASPCSPAIIEHIAAQVRAEGIEPRYLASGAGHDGMAIADLTPIGMLFVRCGNGGVSHHPAETMTAGDADVGARIFLNVLRNYPRQRPAR
ncbi:MAG TPA: allantoate amidohydrolase [Casimicrobiaceae bacterium]